MMEPGNIIWTALKLRAPRKNVFLSHFLLGYFILFIADTERALKNMPKTNLTMMIV